MTNFFDLPDKGNTITHADIGKGILRITVHAKPFFTNLNKVAITIGGKRHNLSYTSRIGRSDLLHIGKSIISSNSIQASSRLRFTKTGHGEFILENLSNPFTCSETDDIQLPQLHILKKKYWTLLNAFPFPKPPVSGDAVSMIRYFKRVDPDNHYQIGPYYRLTVFEAANRIATDLVIINGVIQLIESGAEPKKSRCTIRLGNKHVKGAGDFTINGKEGEAFNVASSFFKIKFRTTTQKWLSGNLEYILVNAEIFSDISLQEVNTKLIKVELWDKE
jgi:hypothetical protein